MSSCTCRLASWIGLVALWCAFAILPALADPPPAQPPGANAPAEQAPAARNTRPKGTQFIRVQVEDGQPVAMQSAIVRYVGENASGQQVFVDLIGVIHIADRKYYQQLNREFETYDALLYELVAPKNARPARGEGGLYGPLASMLELSDQLAVIDYGKNNFVHADMTWEQMSESMKQRKESVINLVFRAIGHSLAQQSAKKGPSDGDLLAALLFSQNRALGLKRVLSNQFADLDSSMTFLEGPDGSTLITERNKVALAVLKDQLAAGKTKIGIFYGAGHLPDMEQRLLGEFKLKKDSQRWLTCWDMSSPAGRKPASPRE